MIEILVSGLVATAASVGGLVLVMRRQEWTLRHSHVVNSLAAGVLLAVAFSSLIPESLRMSPRHALTYVFGGFLLLYVVESIAVFHGCGEFHFDCGPEDHLHASRAWTVFTGLFVHSLVDGLIIGVGYHVKEELGLLATVSVVLHKLPEGATSFALLVGRVRRTTAARLSLLVASATMVGVGIGMGLLPRVGDPALGALLALAAGSFLYVAASDLIPETHTRGAKLTAAFLVGGAVVAYLLTQSLHAH